MELPELSHILRVLLPLSQAYKVENHLMRGFMFWELTTNSEVLQPIERYIQLDRYPLAPRCLEFSLEQWTNVSY